MCDPVIGLPKHSSSAVGILISWRRNIYGIETGILNSIQTGDWTIETDCRVWRRCSRLQAVLVANVLLPGCVKENQ